MENLNIIYQECYTYTGSVNLNKGYIMHGNQNQTHWIYAAGVMDSDGCFMIARYKRGNRYDYLPNVKIAMIKDGAINYIKSETGLGSIIINGTRKSRPNSLPLYEWRITNKRDLITFIDGILPYLRNKKERALHLLDFCKKGNYAEKGEARSYRLSKEELDYREEAYQKMRKLNDNKVGATTKSQGHESAYDSLNL
jgi:hypothetical protein